MLRRMGIDLMDPDDRAELALAAFGALVVVSSWITLAHAALG